MLWEGTDHLGEPTSIFTGAFAEHYGAPSGFCFDILCNTEDPIEDDENLQEFNLDQKVCAFSWGEQLIYYSYSHFMQPGGSYSEKFRIATYVYRAARLIAID